MLFTYPTFCRCFLWFVLMKNVFEKITKYYIFRQSKHFFLFPHNYWSSLVRSKVFSFPSLPMCLSSAHRFGHFPEIIIAPQSRSNSIWLHWAMRGIILPNMHCDISSQYIVPLPSAKTYFFCNGYQRSLKNFMTNDEKEAWKTLWQTTDSSICNILL